MVESDLELLVVNVAAVALEWSGIVVLLGVQGPESLSPICNHASVKRVLVALVLVKWLKLDEVVDIRLPRCGESLTHDVASSNVAALELAWVVVMRHIDDRSDVREELDVIYVRDGAHIEWVSSEHANVAHASFLRLLAGVIVCAVILTLGCCLGHIVPEWPSSVLE